MNKQERERQREKYREKNGKEIYFIKLKKYINTYPVYIQLKYNTTRTFQKYNCSNRLTTNFNLCSVNSGVIAWMTVIAGVLTAKLKRVTMSLVYTQERALLEQKRMNTNDIVLTNLNDTVFISSQIHLNQTTSFS